MDTKVLFTSLFIFIFLLLSDFEPVGAHTHKLSSFIIIIIIIFLTVNNTFPFYLLFLFISSLHLLSREITAIQSCFAVLFLFIIHLNNYHLTTSFPLPLLPLVASKITASTYHSLSSSSSSSSSSFF